MGYYIQTPMSNGRLSLLPPVFEDIEPDEAIICIIDNGPFEAAGFCFNQDELNAFTNLDGRPRTWVVIDRELACKLTGYKEVA